MLDLLEEKFEERLASNDPLLSWKQKSWDRLLELGWPKEAVSFKDLPFSKEPGSISFTSIHPYPLVFIDGFFDETHSRIPPGIIALPLEQAIRPYGIFLQNRLTKALKEESDPFVLLNGAFQGRAVFLYVPPKIEAKITVELLFTKEEVASPRLMLYLGRGARLEIEMETRNPGISNAHFDAVLDLGAECVVKEISRKAPQGTRFQSIRASLKRDSRFAMHLYSEGAFLARTSLKVQLLEENSETLLQGLCKLGDQRQHQIYSQVEHLAPHTRSRQHFKAVLHDKSRFHFEGKIYVHPIAQKTESYQLSNNLLLSDEAFASCKPNLEVLADDVKASHGATIAQLNVEDLFYLRSRGLSLEEAKQCLIEGFCSELIHCLPKRA